MAVNDAIIPHRLLLQISALLESLPTDAAEGVNDEFSHTADSEIAQSPVAFVFVGRTEEAGEVHRHPMTALRI